MLTDIRLQNFRSYKDASFELGPSVNIIVGPNGSGKTNLLEAILVVCTGKSYRARDENLLKKGAMWSRIDTNLPAAKRSVKLKNTTAGTNKTFELDEKEYRILPFEQTLPIILFEPNDLWLLGGEPRLRRDYLDDLLEQTTSEFKEIRNRYSRTLKQRNTALKKGVKNKNNLFIWDVRLSEAGGQIAAARTSLLKQINDRLSKTYSDLAKQKTLLKIRYQSKLDPTNYASQMLRALEKNLEIDYLRGFTGAGPHRDNFTIDINHQPMNQVASRGETRTLLLAFKLIELEIIETKRKQKPLLLLDDVFSELDGKRRKAITEMLKNYQTFITTTDADIIAKRFSQNALVIAL